MRSQYQQKKWDLFQEIEKLDPKSNERSNLLAKFNNTMLPPNKNDMYYMKQDNTCQYCGGTNIKRITARDEYYDICQTCEEEQVEI